MARDGYSGAFCVNATKVKTVYYVVAFIYRRRNNRLDSVDTFHEDEARSRLRVGTRDVSLDLFTRL